jgi:hypothetical protein
MLEDDDQARADESARRLDPRSLATHFHDPEAAIGRHVAAALGSEGEIAWDIYLLFPAEGRWAGGPPAPAEWAHQLWNSRWADRGRYRTGDELGRSLRRALARLIPPAPRPEEASCP